ncbi:MAG: hypothetical protein Q8O98_02790 [bacterium]|nr:hypothetical protein [bacterium]
MIWAILSITTLFVIGLVLKKVFPKLCAICFAVSVTWIIGFFFLEPLVLAILLGGSAVGLMYYWKLEFFRLPYLLTTFTFIYFILEEIDWQALTAVVAVWLIFGVISLLRDGATKSWFKKVVECCRNW